MVIGDNYPEGKDAICPACGIDMEKGYIVSARGIFWNHQLSVFSCTGETIGPYSGLGLKCSYIQAYRCRKCRLLRYLDSDRPSRFVKYRCPSCQEWNEYYKKARPDDRRICLSCGKEFVIDG
ncbi:MAG: PF20097 family protein [Candidatus Thorarchaeota archaeon]